MADYGAQGGYGGDQFHYPNLVGGGQGGFNQQQAGGSDQEAIKQQKFGYKHHEKKNEGEGVEGEGVEGEAEE